MAWLVILFFLSILHRDARSHNFVSGSISFNLLPNTKREKSHLNVARLLLLMAGLEPGIINAFVLGVPFSQLDVPSATQLAPNGVPVFQCCVVPSCQNPISVSNH